MTPEESLRIGDIGRGHVVTPPPEAWIETPGEFEPLNGVFITWIWNSYNAVFREIVREVVEVSRVYIVVGSSTEQDSITHYLQSSSIPLDSVEFYIWPRNSIWMRDYGPWFMRTEDNAEGIVDFIYNRPRPQDDTIPWRIGDAWGIPVYGSPLEHAGGNFMVDGLGTGFASTLIYEENPSCTPEEIDSLMLSYCGLEQIIVMPRIKIEYTGHIDLWTKILNDTLVMVGEYAPGHPNHVRLNENADSIGRCTNREGYPYRVVRIPMPWSTSSAPPSYLNSLIVNNKVLVPLWNQPEDDTALYIYQQILPEHEIVGINCSAMSGSGGAIHCITMQIPSASFLHVQHYPLYDTEDTLNPYRVRARITTSSNLLADSTNIFYKINSGSFTVVPLATVPDTPGVYAGSIPAQASGDTVYYYIEAKTLDGIRRTSPNHVPVHIYSFRVGIDVIPPEISHTPLGDQVINNWPAHVTAMVTDNASVDSVILEYQVNNIAQTPIPMMRTTGDRYETDFAGSVAVGDSILYRIKAIDGSTNHNVAYHPLSGYHAFAIVDRIPICIWEPEATPITSVPLMQYLDSVGITYDHHTSYPTLNSYGCLFICLGVYPNSYQLSSTEANDLIDYLTTGGNCYMEGADAWAFDPASAIYCDHFGIVGIDDGGSMSGAITGVAGTFTEEMSFAYVGENNYIDRIAPIAPAYTIFTNNGYNRTVAYDAGTYKTIGSSFELGGLVDATPPSTKYNLIEHILTFYDIVTGISERERVAADGCDDFALYPNPVREPVTCNFHLSQQAHVSIEVYNVVGQKVKVIVDRVLSAGDYTMRWNLRDRRNRELAQGTYFCRITTDTRTKTVKILYIK
jgi:agmatine/peptidylarginine deiminase